MPMRKPDALDDSLCTDDGSKLPAKPESCGSDSGLAVPPPPHVQSWINFLATVEVRGPIPITFSVLQDRCGVWILRSEMRVPDRNAASPCGGCARLLGNQTVILQNALPGPDDPTQRELVIRQRVLGHYQHEALESILIAGHRVFDPHEARWDSNLVANWRFNF